MKKIILGLFIVSVIFSMQAKAEETSRTALDKLMAAQTYLKTLDDKIEACRKSGDSSQILILRDEKNQTIARMKDWKAEIEGTTITTMPVSIEAPVAPAPVVVPVPVAVAPLPSSLMGKGIKGDVNIGYLGFVGTEVIRADIICQDNLGIANKLNCSPESVNWKIGLGRAFGKDSTGTYCETTTLFVDNVIDFTRNAPFETGVYLGYGLNWTVSGIGSASSFGGEVYLGIKKFMDYGYAPYLEYGWQRISGGVTADGLQGGHINLGLEFTL